MMMHANKEPSELRHIQTFTHATLVCYEISVHFNRLKGQKNVGTSQYFLAKTHYYVYILWRDAQKRKTSTYCAKKGIFMTLLRVYTGQCDANSHITQSKTRIL